MTTVTNTSRPGRITRGQDRAARAEQHIESMHELTDRDRHRFRVWRSNRGGDDYGGVNPVTLRAILATLPTFHDFCASIDAVPNGMRERVKLPDVAREDESRHELLGMDRGRQIVEYLETCRYASHEQVVFEIL